MATRVSARSTETRICFFRTDSSVGSTSRGRACRRRGRRWGAGDPGGAPRRARDRTRDGRGSSRRPRASRRMPPPRVRPSRRRAPGPRRGVCHRPACGPAGAGHQAHGAARDGAPGEPRPEQAEGLDGAFGAEAAPVHGLELGDQADLDEGDAGHIDARERQCADGGGLLGTADDQVLPDGLAQAGVPPPGCDGLVAQVRQDRGDPRLRPVLAVERRDVRDVRHLEAPAAEHPLLQLGPLIVVADQHRERAAALPAAGDEGRGTDRQVGVAPHRQDREGVLVGRGDVAVQEAPEPRHGWRVARKEMDAAAALGEDVRLAHRPGERPDRTQGRPRAPDHTHAASRGRPTGAGGCRAAARWR